jgi:hypothetical protein
MTQRNIIAAKGSRGFLIWNGQDYMFRVYHDLNPEGFTDYALLHSDLEIEILDEDSAFYDSACLDHAPETLGLSSTTTKE